MTSLLLGILSVGLATLGTGLLARLAAAVAFALGGVCSVPLRRFAPLEVSAEPPGVRWWDWLALMEGWARTFGGIFAIALATAIVGSQHDWGITAAASTVAWWTSLIFAVGYFLSGVGKGIYPWHNRQIAQQTGLGEALLERIALLTVDQQRVVGEKHEELDRDHRRRRTPELERRDAIAAEIGQMLDEYERQRLPNMYEPRRPPPSEAPPEQPTPARCSGCGQALVETQHFCGYCGQAVARPE